MTVFTLAENVHFAKDVGLIPQYLARRAGFDATLLCGDHGGDLPYARELAPDVRVVRVPVPAGYKLGGRPAPAILREVRARARTTDILHLFHMTRESMQVAMAYKLRNPRGKVYIKLDTTVPWIREWDLFDKRVSRRQRLLGIAGRAFMAAIPALVTAESAETLEEARRIFPELGDRLRLAPNGIDDDWLGRHGRMEVDATGKEDLLLVVGRIGTEQKNHEMLLEALESIAEPRGWKIAFVGPVEEAFRSRVADFLERNPRYRDRLELVGRIDDREELYSWYARAKVFCLTSRFEGFCLSLVDALHFGCHIVSTPITSLSDMTDGGRLGEVAPDAAALRSSLEALFEGRTDPLRDFDQVRARSERFRWSAIADGLAAALRG